MAAATPASDTPKQTRIGMLVAYWRTSISRDRWTNLTRPSQLGFSDTTAVFFNRAQGASQRRGSK